MEIQKRGKKTHRLPNFKMNFCPKKINDIKKLQVLNKSTDILRGKLKHKMDAKCTIFFAQRNTHNKVLRSWGGKVTFLENGTEGGGGGWSTGLRNFHPQKAWEIFAGNFRQGRKHLEISGNVWKILKKIWKYMGTGGGLVRETVAKHRKLQQARWTVLGLPKLSSSILVQLLWVITDHDLARKTNHTWRQVYTSWASFSDAKFSRSEACHPAELNALYTIVWVDGKPAKIEGSRQRAHKRTFATGVSDTIDFQGRISLSGSSTISPG